ncbi:hypothetical protein [Variovorax sp. RCC_210]|uniref:lipase family protein n=1 Tax=Variovorax sp. RCC_210 TaxID=3239217 RepID=UPI0035250B59
MPSKKSGGSLRLPRFAQRAFGACCGALVLTLMQGCVSLTQPQDTALSREPGERVLGHSVDVVVEAKKHWEFAWLSTRAYNAHYIEATGTVPELPRVESGSAGVQSLKAERDCPKPDDVLKDADWHRWEDFPGPMDDGLAERLRKAHLRVEVWEHVATRRMAVAFGGTVFTNASDWLSNIRWFLPEREDEYTMIQKEFVKAFVARYKARASEPSHEYLRSGGGLRLYATGHSLGGGLAQQFAYALPADPDVPRVERVYAFDPSPVTGYYSVDEAVRAPNAKRLEIDRIYERGEALAFVRSITNFFVPPAADEPKIRSVRYALFYNVKTFWNVVGAHSIPRLACELDEAKNRPPPPAGVAVSSSD